MNTSRRAFLAAAASACVGASAQTTRDFSSNQPVRYPEPDVVSLDPSFDKYKIGQAPLQRLYTGSLWAEGPAWNGEGRFLLWSDVAGNKQMRWLEEDGHVSAFRNPSGYSNGNTFDYEGRQVSCQNEGRRVVRYEHNGSVTVIADKYQGKPFNSPNDIVVHPDGTIWFTDPSYGIQGNYEGFKATPELKPAVYRVDPKTARVDMLADSFGQPNGICFSPDYKKLYVADSDQKTIQVFDIPDTKSIRNQRLFSNMKTPKGSGLADGIRCDTDGNIWAGAGWVGAGYDGVHIINPAGTLIGQILLPEICANLCFGGSRRNRLFMAGSQSLYSVFTQATGAHIA